MKRTDYRQYGTHITLPTTTRLHPFGNSTIPSGTVVLASVDCDERLIDNTADLIDVLYRHGVTTPSQLSYVLALAGHPSRSTLAAPAPDSPMPASPATPAAPRESGRE